MASAENDTSSKPALIPLSIEPPSHRHTHGKLSFCLCLKFSRRCLTSVPSGSHYHVCLARPFQTLLTIHLRRGGCGRPGCISLFERLRTLNAPREKFPTQLHHSHIAMSCNPTIAGKASLTRLSPPICASALDSRFETELKTVGRCERSK